MICEERVTVIEPAWPAWKAWDQKDRLGWSTPGQAGSVPSPPWRRASGVAPVLDPGDALATARHHLGRQASDVEGPLRDGQGATREIPWFEDHRHRRGSTRPTCSTTTARGPATAQRLRCRCPEVVGCPSQLRRP